MMMGEVFSGNIEFSNILYTGLIKLKQHYN
jgi:hypothetical protein